MGKTKDVIFWDFDGVILNSNQVRDKGFEIVLAEYPKEQVNRLLKFHRANGGLSRYVKFRYFFEDIRKERLTDKNLLFWTNKFKDIMKERLIDKSLLNDEIISFIKNNQPEYDMIIVSGSDQEELRYICRALEITHLFRAIHGSPTPKVDWVQTLMRDQGIHKNNCFLVGDSKNDKEAAMVNGIEFFAYGSKDLRDDKQFKTHYLID